jgi:hypothetical protein
LLVEKHKHIGEFYGGYLVFSDKFSTEVPCPYFDMGINIGDIEMDVAIAQAGMVGGGQLPITAHG